MSPEQLTSAFLRIQEHNRVLHTVLDRSEKLGIKSWAVGAGFLQQTTWNHLRNVPMYEGIKDIDWVYYEGDDMSEAAESEVACAIKSAMHDISIRFDVKNQARVHLWYEKKFGYNIRPYLNLEDAIATWPTTSTAIAVTRVGNQNSLIAPFGLSDLLNRIIRPNKRQITREIYEAKVERWRSHWPECQIMGWEES